jgi:hypothetical protein
MKTLEQAKQFLRDEIKYLGGGFHPDTDFHNYIDVRNPSVTLYSDKNADKMNANMELAFDLFDAANEDIYEFCIVVMNGEEFTPEQIKAMRDWAKDCQWADDTDSDFVDELTDEQVIKGVQQHYDGGLTQFVKDCEPVNIAV